MSETSSTRGGAHVESVYARAAREEAATQPNIIEALREVELQLARAKPSRDCEARVLGSREVSEAQRGRRPLLMLAAAMSLVVTGLVVRRTTDDRDPMSTQLAGSSEAASEGDDAAVDDEDRSTESPPHRAPEPVDHELDGEGEPRPTRREASPEETFPRPHESLRRPRPTVEGDGASFEPTPTARALPPESLTDSRDLSSNRISRRGTTLPRGAVVPAPNGPVLPTAGESRGSVTGEPSVEHDEPKSAAEEPASIPERGRQEEDSAEQRSPQLEDDSACDGLDGLGSYHGYLCSYGSEPYAQADAISCADALAACEESFSSIPSLSAMCTWDDVVIFVHETSPGACEESPAQPVCGLFRGGLIEAENMIASPNPANSIEDSDEACIAYCDASEPELGDVCARDGNVIKSY